jgi:hypothetical protein
MPMNLYLPETRYAVASLPLNYYDEAVAALRGLEGFVSLTRDKDEITLIVAEETWQQLAARFAGAKVQGGRRMIVFDEVLDFTVVGFIAEISRALAEANISILNLSTYRTDAVLIHESRFEAAVAAVKRALVTLQYTHLSQQ